VNVSGVLEIAKVEFGPAASVTCPARRPHEIVTHLAMTHFPHAHTRRRAQRIQLGDTVPALVLQQDGQQARAKLQTVSVTGGVLRLREAMAQGDLVEVAFQTAAGPVHGMAEMLNPQLASVGAVQPFRFIALADEDHRALRNLIDLITDRYSVRVNSSLLAELKRS
jgi:hypothetical protein